MRFYILFLLISVMSGGLAAQVQPGKDVNIGAPESWITKVDADMDAQPSETETESVYYLLLDRQTHLDEESKFFQCAYRITSIDGLQEYAEISVNFDPGYEQITFHEINIVREGVAHNQLHPAGIKVVQKEQQMDRYLYDDSRTAIVHLQDLRVGDVVNYSFTRKGFNPVFDGHYSEQFLFQYSMPYVKGHYRVVSPKSRKIFIDYKNGAARPAISTSEKTRTYTWNFEKVQGLRYPDNAPGWYSPYSTVLLTDFESWEDVNTWAKKYYSRNTGEQNKLKAEVGDYFLGESREATAVKVLRFVQDEVRYLGFEDGMHSHMPHPPLQVFRQRYGDCKDKSMLLCALLACYDIEANPVLVNSTLRHTVRDLRPALSVFDHVVAQIVLNGDTVYVDPTMSNQGGDFRNIFFPDYVTGFVIHPGYGGLRAIGQNTVSMIEEENLFVLQQKGEGSSLMVSTKYHGVEADIMRQQISGNSLDNLQEYFIDYYGNLYPAISAEFPMKVLDDRDLNFLHITEYYQIPEMWDTLDNMLITEFYVLGLDQFTGVSKSSQRNPAPYQLNYPTHFAHETIIRLPEFWNVEEEELDIAGSEYSYSHSLRYQNDEVRSKHTYKTLSSYVPAENITTYLKNHQIIRDNLSFQLIYDLDYVVEEGATAWTPIMITIFTILFGLWCMVKLYRYEPDAIFLTENQDGLPIGGWLVLFAIGVVLTPFILIYQIFIFDLFFNPVHWTGFMRAGNITSSLFMSVQLIFNIILLLFSITFAILFFQRRSTVPKLVSLKYAGHISLLTLIMLFGANFVDDVEYSNSEWGDLIKVLLAGVVWIWYFSLSQRVRGTFVRRLE